MFKIGDIEIKNRIIAAPLAGISNEAYRKILFDMGAGLVYSEMVSDKGINFNNKKTLNMLKIGAQEHPLSMQIFGGDVASLVEAAKTVERLSECDIIDINMGCPVKKVVKTGGGCMLLLDEEKAYNLAKAVVDAVKKPVTVKMRIGWDDNNINVVKMAQLMEKAGVKAIAIHGRTREQMYSGEARWEYIKLVKQAVSIPVIGNGDVLTPEDAKQMLEETGCDAVMIGRGYLGNPWLIKQAVAFLDDGSKLPLPSLDERLGMLIYHAEQLIDLYEDEVMSIREMRSHFAWYIKGTKNSNQFKVSVNEVNTLAELVDLVNQVRIANIEDKPE
jgi:nifR3 family TIM-barrel protein